MYAFAPRDELLESFCNLSCLDSADVAGAGRRELDIRRDVVWGSRKEASISMLVERRVDIGELVARAVSEKAKPAARHGAADFPAEIAPGDAGPGCQ